MEQLAQIIFYIGILTLGVNVITEVLKKIFVLKDGSHAGILISAAVSLILRGKSRSITAFFFYQSQTTL